MKTKTGFGPMTMKIRPVLGKGWKECVESMLDAAIIFGPTKSLNAILYDDGVRVIEYLHELFLSGELRPKVGSSADSLLALARGNGFDFKKTIEALCTTLENGVRNRDVMGGKKNPFVPNSENNPKRIAALKLLDSIEPEPAK